METLLSHLVDGSLTIIGDQKLKISCTAAHNVLPYSPVNNITQKFAKYGYIIDYASLANITIDYDNIYASLFTTITNKYVLDNPIVSYRKDKYIYLNKKDSLDYDITRVDITTMSVDKQKEIVPTFFSCIGFNTYGYYKYIIRDYSQHINLIDNNGLYINKDKWVFSDKNQKIIKNKINNYIRNDGNNIINNLTFTITTCKRLDYFIESMDTFILRCQDIDFIDLWICIDNNSSESDRNIMKERYPFFTFIYKTVETKGHAKSMNILWDTIKTDYVFHFEDDWKIIDDFRIINFFNYMKNNCDQLIFVLTAL